MCLEQLLANLAHVLSPSHLQILIFVLPLLYFGECEGVSEAHAC